nr:NAD(P)/FAD-dependent oxidoreductase [Salidesulfovibrio onnuriiensis]
MQQYDAIILGAGASGLYCALHAARRGRSVAVLDHGPKVARKVRISGGGRCNFTNLECGAGHFLSENPHFCKSALARHTPWDVVAFFAEHGIGYEEKAAGQLFSDQGAGRVAGVLAEQCHRSGVAVLLEREIGSVSGTGPFQVETNGESLEAPKLVLALGGRSWPQVGASDLGYRLARQFGLNVVKPRPGLVPLVLSGKEAERCNRLAGTALPVAVSTNGQTFTDDLLFTHKGISGPAVLQVSSYWQSNDPVLVDLMPGRRVEVLVEENRRSNALFRKVLQSCLPKRILPEFIPKSIGETPVSQLSNKQLQQAADALHRWEVIPSGTEGWKKAEVSCGGVDTAELSSKTLEVNKVPGLHVIGELLDVTGHLGGHNLQWAWASAHAVGVLL